MFYLKSKAISVLLIIFCFISFSIYPQESIFSEIYHIKGIKRINQAEIAEISNEDVILFILDDQQIKSFRSNNDGTAIDEFLIDFTYHNFSQITDIETDYYSNYQNYLFFISIESDILCLNLLRCEKSLEPSLINDFRLNIEKEGYKTFYTLHLENDKTALLLFYDNRIEIVNFNYKNSSSYYNYLLSIEGATDTLLKTKSKAIIRITNKYHNSIYIFSSEDGELLYNNIDLKNDEIKDANYSLINNNPLLEIKNVDGEVRHYAIDWDNLLFEEIIDPVDLKFEIVKDEFQLSIKDRLSEENYRLEFENHFNYQLIDNHLITETIGENYFKYELWKLLNGEVKSLDSLLSEKAHNLKISNSLSKPLINIGGDDLHLILSNSKFIQKSNPQKIKDYIIYPEEEGLLLGRLKHE